MVDYSEWQQSGYPEPQYHWHAMPNLDVSSNNTTAEGDPSNVDAKSILSRPGMPKPALQARPKQKFTLDEDRLLIDLKENFHLAWNEIACFFPGRSSATLQVRYCTRLKVKLLWTEKDASPSITYTISVVNSLLRSKNFTKQNNITKIKSGILSHKKWALVSRRFNAKRKPQSDTLLIRKD